MSASPARHRTPSTCSSPDLLLVALATSVAYDVLRVDNQIRETGYWCGPAATRIALSALAAELGTTENGTDWPETIYHYFTVIGYDDVDSTVYIADS
jgi:hypothetical protein